MTDMEKGWGRPMGYGDKELEETERKAALWEKHQWRAQVHLAREWIELYLHEDNKEGPELPYTEYLARAFVRTARKLKLPLWAAVAIAQQESRFDQSAVGKAGEVSLMQIKAFKDRPMKKIKDDPAFAIEWAMRNCFYPGYEHYPGNDQEQKIRACLRYYNGVKKDNQYVNEVMAIGAEMTGADSLWAEVPE